jgi:aryl-alcohol dehydrogenase-like predicted oxidoreductase
VIDQVGAAAYVLRRLGDVQVVGTTRGISIVEAAIAAPAGQGYRTLRHQDGRMQYRTLGKTGLKISEIGFGCGTGAALMISGDPAEQKKAIARALELGVTYFDTAPIYGEMKSEINLGRVLKELDVKPIVVTKVALQIDELDDVHASTVKSVEASLQRLQRDAVEVVYLHNRIGTARAPKPDIGVGALLTVEDVLGPRGVLSGLEELRSRKLVQHFGCCSYGGDMAQLDKVIASDKFQAMLVHYSVLNQTAFAPPVPGSKVHNYGQVAAHAAARGMGIANLRVMEAGLLADNSREKADAVVSNKQRSHALDFLKDGDATLAPAAVRFALSNPAVSVALIGVSEVWHIEAAVAAAARGPLSADALAKIEAARGADFAVR